MSNSKKVLLGLLGGGVVGYAAWFTIPALQLLLLLPLMMVRMPNRVGAAAVAFAYFLAFARDVPHATAQFFPEWPAFAGVALWIVHAAILAAPFLLLNPTGTARSRSIAMVAIALILSLPPLGLLAWGNPLIAAGAVFPGMGVAGLVAVALMMACLVTIETQVARMGALALAVLSVALNALYENPRQPDGWVGVDTHLPGRFPADPAARALRTIAVVDAAKRGLEQGGGFVVLPESIAGPWRPALSESFAKLPDRVMIGAVMPTEGGYLNALVDRDGNVLASSRVPMPIGDWKPGGAKANIWASDLVQIDWHRVAVSICYEDYILWPHRGLLTWQADLMVSASNNWSVAGRDAVRIQRVSAEALARLAGAPLVRAVNY